MPTANYYFGIDLDGDGDVLGDSWRVARFLGSTAVESAENVSTRVRRRPIVTISRGRDIARELSPPRAGSIQFVLDNPDEAFSQENTASPIYGKMVPGRLIRARAEYPAATWTDLFAGYLDIPDEDPYRRRQLVRVTALDGLARLKAAKVATAMYTSITADVAIGHVLDAAGWPAAKRSLQTGKVTLARWWVDGVDAFSAIKDLVLTEGPGALFYINGAGTFVFEDRHYRLLTTRSTTSQATVRDTGTEPIYKAYSYIGGLAGIVNECTIPVRSYTVAGAAAAIWTGPTPITFAANETKTYKVSTTADGFTGAINPAGGTDYTVSAGAISSATLNRTSGKSATLTIVAGASGATITGLQVRAQTVAISAQDVSHTIDTSASQDEETGHGIRSLQPDYVPNWVPTVAEAQDWSNATVTRYQTKVPQVTFSLTNGHADALTQALTRQISDRVTVVNSPTGLNADFIVEAIEHKISGQNQETAFYCEKAASQAYWVLGVAGYSEVGETTVLGY